MNNCYPRKDQRAMLITDKQFAALEKYIAVDFGCVYVLWHNTFTSDRKAHDFTTELNHFNRHVMFEDISQIPKEILQQFPFWTVTIGAPQLEQFDLTQYDAESDQFRSVVTTDQTDTSLDKGLDQKMTVCQHVGTRRLRRKRKHGAQVRPSRHRNKNNRGYCKSYAFDFETVRVW